MSLRELMRLHWAAMERARIEAFGFIVPDDARRRRKKPVLKVRPSKRRPVKKKRVQKFR